MQSAAYPSLEVRADARRLVSCPLNKLILLVNLLDSVVHCMNLTGCVLLSDEELY